jgi:hypothetical protein
MVLGQPCARHRRQVAHVQQSVMRATVAQSALIAGRGHGVLLVALADTVSLENHHEPYLRCQILQASSNNVLATHAPKRWLQAAA